MHQALCQGAQYADGSGNSVEVFRVITSQDKTGKHYLCYYNTIKLGHFILFGSVSMCVGMHIHTSVFHAFSFHAVPVIEVSLGLLLASSVVGFVVAVPSDLSFLLVQSKQSLGSGTQCK